MPSLTRNGISLFHEEAGGAGTPVVLIHGWCCDHSYFAPQFEHFAERGHGVVAVDLRGHGQSDKPDLSYPMPEFADDVAWLSAEIGLDKPIIVGHSMGGIVAFDIAARYPHLPSAIVMIDSAVIRPSAAHGSFAHFLDDLRGDDYQRVLRDYVASALMLPTDDAKRSERIIEAMIAAPRHVMVGAFEAMLDYDPSFAKGRIAAPSLYIAADEPEPRSNMEALRELLPGLRYGQTVGSGHFCQLEVPDQVNAMIERFVAIL